MTGLSLISDHWRAAGSFGLNLVTRSVTGRLSGTIRGGIYGDYGPDLDESYDILRLVEFIRYNPPARSNFYLRAGLIDRMRLGTGHLVNFFNSATAWDERTVGVESKISTQIIDIEGFADNFYFNGITGGRVAIRPFFWGRDRRTQTFEIGFTYVSDRSRPSNAAPPIEAYNVDMRFNALSSGDIMLIPFASFAWYENYGSGIGFGADLESPNFIDLARFRIRFALYYNGLRFIPGYIGPFYAVNNPHGRILNAKKYLEGEPVVKYEGVSLDDALGGNDLETEFRLLIFERFELWYYFRRHYGTQSLSEYHLRLFLHARNRLRIDVGMDRGGLLNLLTLFNDLGDQTALVVGLDYRMMSSFWFFLDSRYTFTRIEDGSDGTKHFLVQRRFEPFAGLRFSF